MAKVYLGLGSNIGDRVHYLSEALNYLEKNNFIQINDVSNLYQTSPVGKVDQDSFLNIVAKINTSYTPDKLLSYIHTIEKELGRKREIIWGPRTIDIDIILYEDVKLKEKRLQIPHIEMMNRLFVLVPLVEVFDDSKEEVKTIKKRIEELKISSQKIEEFKGEKLLWKRKNN